MLCAYGSLFKRYVIGCTILRILTFTKVDHEARLFRIIDKKLAIDFFEFLPCTISGDSLFLCV